MKPRGVTQRMAGRFHPAGAAEWAWSPLPVTVSWCAADPLALRITMDEVQWEVARSLVLEGLDRSAGMGDVIVYPEPPAVTSTASTRTRIAVRVEDERAVVSVTTKTLRKVVEASYASAGDEVDDDALEAELRALVAADSR